VLRLLKLPLKILGALVALGVLYVAFTFAQVWWTSRHDTHASAGAMVVMGAAQWNGKPSPVLKARLDHAVDLYRAGRAPMIIVTGGKQPGDRVTQGFAGYDYLKAQGVPESDIKIEVQGRNSYEELSAAAVIVRQANAGPDVLLVSDPYHALRISQIAEEVGLRPHVSPADTPSPLRSLVRETVAVSIGRIIGYRRLAAFA
jgi:uncharacterized SAM-binding protein YcdF (DUF218 family)